MDEVRFQSSPGPKAGRCAVLAPAAEFGDSLPFQSSPGPKAGRCFQRLRGHGMDEVRFQSSPGPKAGRCAVLAPAAEFGDSLPFQSSPGPKAGRCPSGTRSRQESEG